MTGITQVNKQGFTLVEVLVAITIFSGILLLLISIVTHTTFVQKRQQGTQATQEELRFALDLFNREARTAYGNTFSGSATRIDFRNQNGLCVEYNWNQVKKTLERAEVSTTDPTARCDSEVLYTNYKSLVSPKIEIQKVIFTIHPAQVDAATNKLTEQGFVVISLQAAAHDSPTTVLHFQSAVTSRQAIPFQTL